MVQRLLQRKAGLIEFYQNVCADLEAGLQLEWLETNGLGGFSSSTIAGVNTRRYHGLLTAALHPPVSRYVLLSKLEETLVIGGQRFDLSANTYAGAVHPQGYRYLKHFRLDPFPVFTYQVDDVEIEKRVFMVHGENTTVIEYDFRSLDREPCPTCTLEIRPLIAFRDYHSLTHANDGLDPSVKVESGMVSVQPYQGLPRLYLAHNAYDVERDGNWYRNFDYAVERERGLDAIEDLFCPLLATFDLDRELRAVVIASTERHDAVDAPVLRAAEIDRRQQVAAASPCDDTLVTALVAAADQFIVKRGNRKTVIAGYHWFSDWGRDTMIALPGLTLVTGRYDLARSILLAFAESIDQGMLPNRYPDAGETPEYNTVDATLWFFEAIRSYVAHTGDVEFIRQHLYLRLKDIIDWHLRGTRYGIHADYDGLLLAGEPGVQLTWMDAKIGDWVVTPRHGKPVEIEALWYNALRVTAEFAGQFGDQETQTLLSQMADRAASSFNRLFWNQQAGCLYDVVNGDVQDAAIRPNQVIALSLHHSMVSAERSRQVLAVVERELLTPFGLRTLAPSDPNYRGRYEGSPSQRDALYHQGTVWPWLLGPFITAYLKVSENKQQARERAQEWLQPFRGHLHQGCLASVSEILDGDPPYTPRGAVAQAWSVAELLRASHVSTITFPPPPYRCVSMRPPQVGQSKARSS